MTDNHLIIIAAAIFCAACVLAFVYRHASRTGPSILLLGIILSSFFLFFPFYEAKSVGTPLPNLRTLVFTLFYGLKSISGGQEIKLLETFELEGAHERIQELFYILNYIYFVLAPVLTSGLVLSFFGDFLDRLRCRFRPGRKYHIFSVLNEHSLHLAKQVKADHRLELIVFCGTKNSNKELILQAKRLGAATLYADCASARFPLIGKRLQYYLIDPNEDINLCCAEELLRRYKDRRFAAVVINAFAESGTGIRMVEELAKHTKSKGVSVRFIDVTALLCNNLLLQHPLYQLPEDRKTVSVMIVGCDKTGMRMLKTVAWASQVDGCGLKIRVYDKNAALQEKKFQAQCPELMDNCDIRFVSVDARTADFEDAVLSAEVGSPDATYVVMSTGDDELNIEVADRIFRLFRHHNRYTWTPKILVRIRNSAKSDIYSDGNNPYLKDRRIYPFGRMEDVFSRNALFHSRLENLAFAVDLCYCGQLPPRMRPSKMNWWERKKYLSPEQLQNLRKNPHPTEKEEVPVELDLAQMCRWEVRKYLASKQVQSCRRNFLHSEYNRRSSMAAALHIGAKLHRSGCTPAEKPLTRQEKVRLSLEKSITNLKKSITDQSETIPALKKVIPALDNLLHHIKRTVPPMEEILLSRETALKFREMLEEERVPMDALAQNEHQRWNQYMRSEGFCQATWEDLECFYDAKNEKKQNNQDALAKRHLCLTGWEELDDLEKKYNDLQPVKKKFFKESDYTIVRQIPEILILADWMRKKNIRKHL